MKLRILSYALALCGLLAATPVLADGGVSQETAFLFNTLFALVCGVLVMFMAAGFTMLEAGMVRSKSVAVICAKNIALYAIAGIAFYLVGFQLMYGSTSLGLIGEWAIWGTDDQAALAGDFTAGQASGANWFFQMVFVATTASVVSGALAERVRFWPFAIFTLALTAVIYPVIGHWTWGGGWLSGLGFIDFAGSTIVHSVGGCAALIGAILLGARRGRFDQAGNAQAMPPSSLPCVTLGTFILWLGWFGFNGGSQLAFGGAADAVAVATVFVNTNLAAASGVIAMLIASQLLLKRLDLPLILNGALAGLVSITAEPLLPSAGQAIAIGAVGALLMMGGSRLLQALRIDDVVDAIPVHLVAGAWGTLAVVFTNPEATLLAQTTGVVAVAAFVALASLLVWATIKITKGIRLHRDHEHVGADLAEVGLRAYNMT